GGAGSLERRAVESAEALEVGQRQGVPLGSGGGRPHRRQRRQRREGLHDVGVPLRRVVHRDVQRRRVAARQTGRDFQFAGRLDRGRRFVLLEEGGRRDRGGRRRGGRHELRRNGRGGARGVGGEARQRVRDVFRVDRLD